MEYLTNRPESTFFSRFLPIFFLALLMLRSFGLHAQAGRCLRFPPERRPIMYEDRAPFNEKRWWIDRSVGDEALICSQRVNVFREFWNESSIECTPGLRVDAAVVSKKFPGVDPHAICLTDDKVLLCQNPDGSIFKYDLPQLPPEILPRRKRRIKLMGEYQQW